MQLTDFKVFAEDGRIVWESVRRIYMREFKSPTLLLFQLCNDINDCGTIYSNDVMYASNSTGGIRCYYILRLRNNIVALCLATMRLRRKCCLLIFVGEMSKKCTAVHWDGQCSNALSPSGYGRWL